MSLLPALRGQGQAVWFSKFQVSQSYVVRPCLKKKKSKVEVCESEENMGSTNRIFILVSYPQKLAVCTSVA